VESPRGEKGYPCEKEPDTFSTFSISLLNGDVTKEADRFPAQSNLLMNLSLMVLFFLFYLIYCSGVYFF
jgi:hypothetical protein